MVDQKETNMATTTTIKTTKTGDTILAAKEARDFFDQRAREVLGMSGPEFLRRWDAGEYRDLPENADTRKVLRIAALIPFGRR
jgi:hypothetical protein